MSPWLSDLFLGAQSDERLVTLARAGHERAFAAIVDRYQSELLKFARRFSSDGAPEDVVQQAFLRAFAALQAGADVRHLRGWLYQIVRRVAYSTKRISAVPLADDASLASESLEDVVQQRLTAMAVLSELGSLPERQREALVGSAVQGLGRTEVAQAMGLSEGAVRQLVHRARATLRTAATALTPYPFARFVASGRSIASADSMLPAGSAAAGGLAVKLGAVAASGVVAASIAAVQIVSPGVHKHAVRASSVAAQHSGAVFATAVGTSARSASGAVVRVSLAGAGRPSTSPGRKSTGGSTHRGHTGRQGGRDGRQDGTAGQPVEAHGGGGSNGDGRSGSGSPTDGGSTAGPSSGSGSGGSDGSGGGSGSTSDGGSHGSGTSGSGSGDGSSSGSTSGSGGPGDGGSTGTDGGSATTTTLSGTSDGGSGSSGTSDGGTTTTDGGSGTTSTSGGTTTTDGGSSGIDGGSTATTDAGSSTTDGGSTGSGH